MNTLRTLVQWHAEEHLRRNDPFGWCEKVYHDAQGDELQVPWASLEPNPHLVRWFREAGWDGNGKKALVVGCGLGDDAEFLSRKGFETTAFDVSPTAIRWAQHRFPRGKVQYELADLFETPESWEGRFDLVVEAYTLQSFQPPYRSQAAGPLASFLAPQGLLWVITRGRNPNEETSGPPWPLTRGELDSLRRTGLRSVASEDFIEPGEDGAVLRYLGLYRK